MKVYSQFTTGLIDLVHVLIGLAFQTFNWLVKVSTTDSKSERLGVKPNLGLLTRDLFSKLRSFLYGALSDERSGLSFVIPCPYSL
jgi:hypothetical protein